MSQVIVMPVEDTLADRSPANPAAAQVLAELQLWSLQFARGELDGDGWLLGADERFAAERTGVRAAGLGHAAATGDLYATDRHARVLTARRRPARVWRFADLADVSVLGNWGGLVLVHPGGETELVVTASPTPPTWRDASGWLKVEGAFAAGRGRLDAWLAELPHRLAALDDA